MAVRLSTLAEIKTFSMSSYLESLELSNPTSGDVVQAISDFASDFDSRADDDVSAILSSINPFKTIGLARSIRISEDFGTINQYAIGAPTRPRIVPNNYQASASIQRIQLDTRDLFSYVTTPEYWYSNDVQNAVGVDDYKFYTYLFIQEKGSSLSVPDIYALMPRSSSKTVSSNNVMIAHDVEMIGYKQTVDSLISLIRDAAEDVVSSFPSLGND